MALELRTIGKEMYISAAFAAILGSAAAKGWMYISTQVERIAEHDRRIAAHDARFRLNRWTCQDQKDFVYELRLANSSTRLVIPPFRKECDQ